MNAPYRSPHLRNKPMNIKEKPGGAMAKPGDGHEEPQSHSQSGGVGTAHASEHGTQPHPVTGVHAVHIHHMGGHVMTHTHHDGGKIETAKHSDMVAAHNKAQEDLPQQNEEMASHDEPDGDEGGSMDMNLDGLSGE